MSAALHGSPGSCRKKHPGGAPVVVYGGCPHDDWGKVVAPCYRCGNGRSTPRPPELPSPLLNRHFRGFSPHHRQRVHHHKRRQTSWADLEKPRKGRGGSGEVEAWNRGHTMLCGEARARLRFLLGSRQPRKILLLPAQSQLSGKMK